MRPENLRKQFFQTKKVKVHGAEVLSLYYFHPFEWKERKAQLVQDLGNFRKEDIPKIKEILTGVSWSLVCSEATSEDSEWIGITHILDTKMVCVIKGREKGDSHSRLLFYTQKPFQTERTVDREYTSVRRAFFDFQNILIEHAGISQFEELLLKSTPKEVACKEI